MSTRLDSLQSNGGSFFLDFFDYFLQQWQKVMPSRRGDEKGNNINETLKIHTHKNLLFITKYI